MKSSLTLTLALALALACACSSPSDPVAPVDAGRGSDARIDASAALDSSTDGGGSAVDAGREVDAGRMPSECEVLANTFATNCSDVAARACAWRAYAQLCRIGNASLLLASMRCLDATECRTFSDPNDGADCLMALHTANQSATARRVITAGCTRCGGTECDRVISAAEIVPYLIDADIEAMETCGGSACSLDDVIAACSSIPAVAPFAACGP